MGNTRISEMAENLQGSEIIKLAGEIKEKMAQGEKIYNFTIGDFDPKVFPIPTELTEAIINAYENGETNYPAANGIAELRAAVAKFVKDRLNLDYSADEFLIAGGARPLIYAAYQALVNPGEKVVFPVPSWNNNHYSHLSAAEKVMIETAAENNFMPTAEELIPHLSEAGLVALCSPLNPTGTVFTAGGLKAICEAIVAENNRRGPNEKPVYLLYDQIYWVLTHGDTTHVNPVEVCPEVKPYTLFIDGLSKAFAATGVRVGWAFGPKKIINAMKSILGHIGAWSPKAEQVATATYLNLNGEVENYLTGFKSDLNDRLLAFYDGIQNLKDKGYNVDAIHPQAAIYLTVKFDIQGQTTTDGHVLETVEDVCAYLLNEAKLAVVPFYAFGASQTSPWFRLSVGTSTLDSIAACFTQLEHALEKLT
ncbi:aspartate/tyrosine/aromatic aminotransferase [Owenweeksia hongkongensis DSM 17368]|uniref:Aspartate/tyrosine/aromatic aminotransferase n=1 Tax=Owenweeksia hongkongensis (strain DSM 17368 / CIP 108786 / JCM 12287 / NRRL B-23963 / UST20020801) TaxID=926562 RepID=G8R8J2_OWEHD|nr:aminotransferase class I/II-fold pyridoxal phosphate-dependent enzyme [Owenweeksia hongkongensis]AEV31374.1 aspartate/tyrosine/aromatic aminotransferase [Owenweeksia hongkongensis DSM 17368]